MAERHAQASSCGERHQSATPWELAAYEGTVMVSNCQWHVTWRKWQQLMWSCCHFVVIGCYARFVRCLRIILLPWLKFICFIENLRICLQILRRFLAELAKFFEVWHRPFQITILCQVFIEVGAYEIAFRLFISRHIFLQFGKRLFVTLISPTNHIRQEMEQEPKLRARIRFYKHHLRIFGDLLFLGFVPYIFLCHNREFLALITMIVTAYIANFDKTLTFKSLDYMSHMCYHLSWQARKRRHKNEQKQR